MEASVAASCGGVLFDASALVYTCSNPSALEPLTRLGLSCGSLSVSIPAARLVEVAFCLDPGIEAQRVLSTGLPGDHHVAFEVLGGRPYLVGPFTASEAATVVRAFRA